MQARFTQLWQLEQSSRQSTIPSLPTGRSAGRRGLVWMAYLAGTASSLPRPDFSMISSAASQSPSPQTPKAAQPLHRRELLDRLHGDLDRGRALAPPDCPPSRRGASVACGNRRRAVACPSRALASSAVRQRLDAGQDGHLLVDAAPRDRLPPGVEPLQVEDRLRDEERRAGADLLRQPRHLQVQRIGVGRGHGAQAERAGARRCPPRPPASRRRPGGRRSGAIGRSRCRRRSSRRGSGPSVWWVPLVHSRLRMPRACAPRPRRPGRCGCGRAWSRAGSARRPRRRRARRPPAPTSDPVPIVADAQGVDLAREALGHSRTGAGSAPCGGEISAIRTGVVPARRSCRLETVCSSMSYLAARTGLSPRAQIRPTAPRTSCSNCSGESSAEPWTSSARSGSRPISANNRWTVRMRISAR